MEATIPATGFMRLHQIIGSAGDPRATPPVPPTPGLIPISKTTWYEGVRQGRFPKPVSLGAKAVAWRAEDIRALIEKLAA